LLTRPGNLHCLAVFFLNMKLNIDPQLKALIPPLGPDEKAQLEANILAEGIRDPLVIATYPDEEGEEIRVLADGHNRYEIAERHGLKFSLVQRDFDSLEDVKIWMIDNQQGRRNLTDGWKFELAQVKAQALREKGKQTQGARTDLLSIIDKKLAAPSHNTQAAIAKDLGWSTGKVAMADVVWKQAAPDVKEQVLAGEKTISGAYQEIKKEEKVKAREEYIQRQVEEINQGILPELQGLFNVVSIDPPWPYGREYDPATSRVANPYPEMSIEQIAAIELPLTPDAVVFIWTTHRFLPAAFKLAEGWGLSYKATMVWDKEKMGMGAWLRMQCEFCLLCTKGSPLWVNTSERDILRESRREHSRKPDGFFEMVNKLCHGRKLEYFSREAREGWEIFGNETNKF
jgi:N6-adenosine-specific RNA methylase IME4/ParB-like chromosome segregation protein Spo0J